jgi:hypothetical protein
MIQQVQANRYLEVGDRLVQRGKLAKAAAVYSRYADACVSATWLTIAETCLEADPVGALKALAEVEKLTGASGEGRRLSALAYERLGQTEIAARFLHAG